MTYKDLRIELHKNHYCQSTLTSIAYSILNKLDCEGDFEVKAPLTQIEFHLNTSTPSQLNLNPIIMQAIMEFVSSCGIVMDGEPINMFNILISHVDNKGSTVIVML